MQGIREIAPARLVGVTKMDFVGQYSLKDIIHHKGPPWIANRDSALRNLQNLVYDIGRGLRVLNDAGIIHGDCHTTNWLIGRNDMNSSHGCRVYLIDFDRTLIFGTDPRTGFFKIEEKLNPSLLIRSDVRSFLDSIYYTTSWYGFYPVTEKEFSRNLMMHFHKGYCNKNAGPLRKFAGQTQPNNNPKIAIFDDAYWGPVAPTDPMPPNDSTRAEQWKWRWSHMDIQNKALQSAKTKAVNPSDSSSRARST
jgi:hypothetical protein